MAKEFSGQIELKEIDLDVDENLKEAENLGIEVVPTHIFYDNDGVEKFRKEGLLKKEDVATWLKENVEKESEGNDSPKTSEYSQ